MPETASRSALENALIAYAPRERRPHARAFLKALSLDELLFLGEFLGSCILITSAINMDTWDAVCHNAHARHHRMCRMTLRERNDTARKLVVVSEFAECCGILVKFH